jgi:uncharacterized membrane protein YhhN
VIAATIVCAAACVVLVIAEWHQLLRVRVVSKIVASLAFLLVGLLAARQMNFIVAGLALGVIGDVALLGDGKRAFLIGLGAFLLGHLAYVAGISQLVPPRAWIAPLAAAPVAIGAGALAYLWPRLGSLRVPVICYVATIVAMMAGALAARANTALCLGAALFFASDLAVARDKFVAKTFANKAWGLPAYYAGQLLIAWSLA